MIGERLRLALIGIGRLCLRLRQMLDRFEEMDARAHLQTTEQSWLQKFRPELVIEGSRYVVRLQIAVLVFMMASRSVRRGRGSDLADPASGSRICLHACDDHRDDAYRCGSSWEIAPMPQMRYWRKRGVDHDIIG
jgi:hypothetical protein